MQTAQSTFFKEQWGQRGHIILCKGIWFTFVRVGVMEGIISLPQARPWSIFTTFKYWTIVGCHVFLRNIEKAQAMFCRIPGLINKMKISRKDLLTEVDIKKKRMQPACDFITSWRLCSKLPLQGEASWKGRGHGEISVLYSAPPIPVGIWSFRWNPAESSGVQWNPAEWDWIPVDSTGLQTEIEIELESGSKYMCTNSCKHKYCI